MQRHSRFRVAKLFLASLLALVCSALPARADNNIKLTWMATYPNSTTDDAAVASTGYRCIICHFAATNGSAFNAYGWRIRQNMQLGQSAATAIANAEAANSDGDPAGWSNLAEIDLGAQPGWTPGPHNTRYTTTSTVPGQSPPAVLAVVLDPPCGQVTTYCTSGTTTNGCVPTISASGAPRASASSGFTLTVVGVEGGQSGLIFYGVSGAKASPWGSGSSFHCVKAPLERGLVQSTGGTPGACDGVLALDWNAFVAAHANSLGAPFTGGETVWAQGWFRDPPAPLSTQLSDAVSFVVCP